MGIERAVGRSITKRGLTSELAYICVLIPAIFFKVGGGELLNQIVNAIIIFVLVQEIALCHNLASSHTLENHSQLIRSKRLLVQQLIVEIHTCNFQQNKEGMLADIVPLLKIRTGARREFVDGHIIYVSRGPGNLKFTITRWCNWILFENEQVFFVCTLDLCLELLWTLGAPTFQPFLFCVLFFCWHGDDSGGVLCDNMGGGNCVPIEFTQQMELCDQQAPASNIPGFDGNSPIPQRRLVAWSRND